MTKRDRMLAMFLAQGSAIAGAPLTAETMLERFKDPAFMKAFNAGPRPSVKYPDLETAKLAAEWEAAAVTRKL